MNTKTNNKRNDIYRRKNNIGNKSVIILGVFMVLILSVLVIKNNSYAAPNESNKTICYKPVLVEQGDSLWSIASENMTEEWGSTKDYVAAIQEFNNMKDSKIVAGSYISIPYYANVE